MSTSPPNNRAASDAVLRLINRRWPLIHGGEIGPLLRRATKATGIAGSLADYLRTMARHHDLVARAFLLCARAAEGEDLDALTNEDIAR